MRQTGGPASWRGLHFTRRSVHLEIFLPRGMEAHTYYSPHTSPAGALRVPGWPPLLGWKTSNPHLLSVSFCWLGTYAQGGLWLLWEQALSHRWSQDKCGSPSLWFREDGGTHKGPLIPPGWWWGVMVRGLLTSPLQPLPSSSAFHCTLNCAVSAQPSLAYSSTPS